MAAASGVSIALNNTLDEALLLTESRCERKFGFPALQPAVVRSQ